MSLSFIVVAVEALQPKNWLIHSKTAPSSSSLSLCTCPQSTNFTQSCGNIAGPSWRGGASRLKPLSANSTYLQVAGGKLPPNIVTICLIEDKYTWSVSTDIVVCSSSINSTTSPSCGLLVSKSLSMQNSCHRANLLQYCSSVFCSHPAKIRLAEASACSTNCPYARKYFFNFLCTQWTSFSCWAGCLVGSVVLSVGGVGMGK